MTPFPLVSILIPVHNGEKYLESTLESISFQDYPNLEIILLDDGSTDGTRAIMDSYALSDKRATVHATCGIGVGEARNMLLSLSKGSLVLFVDGDDILSSPSFVSSLYEKKERYGAQAVSARTVPFRDKPGKGKKRRDAVYSGKAFAHMMTRPVGYFCYSHSRLMEKSLFPPSPFPRDMIFEDVVAMPWVLREAGKVVYSGETVYHYRINPEGLSHRPLSPRALDEMEAYWMNCEKAGEKGDRDIALDSAVFFLTKYYYYWFMTRKFSMDKKEYRRRYGERKKRAWACVFSGGKV